MNSKHRSAFEYSQDLCMDNIYKDYKPDEECFVELEKDVDNVTDDEDLHCDDIDDLDDENKRDEKKEDSQGQDERPLMPFESTDMAETCTEWLKGRFAKGSFEEKFKFLNDVFEKVNTSDPHLISGDGLTFKYVEDLFSILKYLLKK